MADESSPTFQARAVAYGMTLGIASSLGGEPQSPLGSCMLMSAYFWPIVACYEVLKTTKNSGGKWLQFYWVVFLQV
jgi:hypothetical protein